MSTPEQDNEKQPHEDEGITFDMYHLFSRMDFILVVGFIIFVLLVTLYFVLSGPATA